MQPFFLTPVYATKEAFKVGLLHKNKIAFDLNLICCIFLWTGCELKQQATQLGVPVTVLSVKMMLARLNEITEEADEKQEEEEDEDSGREMLTSSQRVSALYIRMGSGKTQYEGLIKTSHKHEGNYCST